MCRASEDSSNISISNHDRHLNVNIITQPTAAKELAASQPRLGKSVVFPLKTPGCFNISKSLFLSPMVPRLQGCCKISRTMLIGPGWGNQQFAAPLLRHICEEFQ